MKIYSLLPALLLLTGFVNAEDVAGTWIGQHAGAKVTLVLQKEGGKIRGKLVRKPLDPQGQQPKSPNMNMYGYWPWVQWTWLNRTQGIRKIAVKDSAIAFETAEDGGTTTLTTKYEGSFSKTDMHLRLAYPNNLSPLLNWLPETLVLIRESASGG
jgi:hypothetical protein